MIDYERFMRQQLKKFNPVQQVAYSLIKGDARFIYTLIDISKEPSKAYNNYMTMSQPYIGLFANGAEQWGRKVGLPFVPNFSTEENTYYSLLRQGHKLLDKTYKEYRLQLMDILKQSDDYFYSIRTLSSIVTNVYNNVGTDICHGEYCGNTILCGIYTPFKGFDNSIGPKIRDMSVVAGKLVSFFCLGKPYAYEYDHLCKLSSHDYHFFNNCPLKLKNEVGLVLFSILCSINYCIVFVEKYITEEIPQKFKFCYLMYYYLCDFILDLNKETGLNLYLNSDLKNRDLRNCLAHYGLGQYIKNSDIVQSDLLKGLTIKAFKKDYFEAKEELYKFMNELADQIKMIIF